MKNSLWGQVCTSKSAKKFSGKQDTLWKNKKDLGFVLAHLNQLII